jgi:hypothetical protein
LVEKQWLAKGKSKETMSNFFDMQTRQVTEYVDGVASKIKRDIEAEETKWVGPSPLEARSKDNGL